MKYGKKLKTVKFYALVMGIILITILIQMTLHRLIH